MPLTPEQQAQLDELNRLAEEPDDDEEYEIEIYSSSGEGARLPYRKGKSFLAKHFGIDIGDPPSEPDKDETTNPKTKKAPAKDEKPEGSNLKFLQQRRSKAS